MDKRTIAAMYSFATHTSNRSGIHNMIDLAKSDLAIGIDELDIDPWLLNVENGTIDLRTGEIREHRKEDFVTKLAPVHYDADADCPLWSNFLTTIFGGDEPLIDYMKRLVGYCLTGVTREHILPFLYGTGANGKSTFCETVLALLGPDYAMKAPPDLLMTKHGETHPTDRADLFGKRFVACIETDEGRRFAEAMMKELTGGDRIRARRMREDFWEFTPTHHVWIAGNHKPRVTGTDHGIWRRIKLIPFEVVIPDAQQDKELPEKLKAESSGILNWAIAGCLDWQRNGMNEPSIVRAATSEYSSEMDEVGQFLDEYCEIGSDFEAPATELYQKFQSETGSRMSQQAFGTRLRLRGFESGRITSGPNKARKCWKGFRLHVHRDAQRFRDHLEKTADAKE